MRNVCIYDGSTGKMFDMAYLGVGAVSFSVRRTYNLMLEEHEA